MNIEKSKIKHQSAKRQIKIQNDKKHRSEYIKWA
jgi:hypothetical protein